MAALNLKSGFSAEELQELSGDHPDDAAEVAEKPQVEAEESDEAEESEPEAKSSAKTDDGKGKTEKPPSGYVPKGALDEARREAREARDKAIKIEALFERLQKDIQPRQQQQTQKQDEIPPLETDPVGHFRALNARNEARIAQLEGRTTQQQQAEQQQQRTNQMLQAYATDVRNFAQENTDFNEAYAYLVKSVDDELKARGYTDAVERTNIMQYQEGLMVGRALSQGQSPAQAIHNLAKFRGFKKEAARTETPIEKLQKGAKAAKSLGSGNGSANGEATMSLEALSELYDTDPREADKMWNQMKRKGMLG